jgi:acyl carrier protein
MDTEQPTPSAPLSEAQITERVLRIIRTRTPHEVTLDSTFDSVGLDSLAMAEIVFEIEHEFQIRTDDQLLDLQNMRQVVEYIAHRLQRATTTASNQ